MTAPANPQATEPPPGRHTPPATTESRYLAQRSADAKAAFKAALFAGKTDVKRGLDAPTIIRQQPLVSVGVAAVLGLLLGWLIVPSKARRTAARLATIERILQDEAKARGVRAAPAASRSSALSRWLVRTGMKYVQPMILSSITGAITGAAGGKKAGEEAGEDAGAAAGHEAGHHAGEQAGEEAAEDVAENAAR